MTTAYPLTRADALPEVRSPVSRPLWRRIVEAISFAQQRRAEREIARYVASRGGRFSDAAEREIERHLMSPRIF